MFREYVVGDLDGWNLIGTWDPVLGTTHTFTGLKGNTVTQYKLEYHLKVFAGGTDRGLKIQFNGDTTSNYGWATHFYGTSHNHLSYGPLTSCEIACSISSADTVINGHTIIDTPTTLPDGRRGYDSYNRLRSSTESFKRDYYGTWLDTTNEITSLTVFISGGSVTGSVKLFARSITW